MNYAIDPSEYPTDYWDTEKFEMFWGFVRWFLELNMPWIMLLIGFILAVIVLTVIVNLFFPAPKDKDEKDDDEYEMRYL